MANLPDEVREAIGARIMEARTAAGMTRPELANRAGVSRQTVFRWEQGTTTPTTVAMEQVARVCGVSMRWLTTGKVDTDRQSSEATSVLRAWLETPRGKTASPSAIAFMEQVTIPDGVTVDPIFYDLLLSAYEAGIRAEDAARAATATRAHLDDPGQ